MDIPGDILLRSDPQGGTKFEISAPGTILRGHLKRGLRDAAEGLLSRGPCKNSVVRSNDPKIREAEKAKLESLRMKILQSLRDKDGNATLMEDIAVR